MTIRITTLNKNLKNIYASLDTKPYSVKDLNHLMNQIQNDFKHSKYNYLFELATLRLPIRTAETFLASKNSIEYDDMMSLPNNSTKKQQFLYTRKFVKNYPHTWFLCEEHLRFRKSYAKNGDVNISLTKYPIANLNELNVAKFVNKLYELIGLIRKGYSKDAVGFYASTGSLKPLF